MHARTAILWWILTRLVTLLMLFTFAGGLVTDLNYYRNSLEALPGEGLAHTLVEYPLAAVGVVAAPAVVAGMNLGPLYIWLFLGMLLLVDALFARALFRAGRGATAGTVAWLGMVPALGAVTYTRFDLVPGVLVGLMLLFHRDRPRWSAAALAAAISVKLWPALLVGPFLAATRRRRDAALVIGAFGLVVMGATLALGGWGRLWSPLSYQRDRGLQVESVAATPLMIWRWLHPDHVRVWFAPSRSWEVAGGGVGWLLTASTVTTVLLAVVLAVAWWKAFTRGQPASTEALVWLTLASTTGWLVVGRVLSPQYLLWLAPAASAGLVLVEGTRATLARWTVGLAITAALTNLLYPLCYGPLLHLSGRTGGSVLLLGVRNGGLLVLLFVAVVMARRSLEAGSETAAPAEAQAHEDR